MAKKIRWDQVGGSLTNSVGLPVTYNEVTGSLHTRSYEQLIADLPLQNYYIPLAGTGSFTGAIKSPNSSVQFGNDGYYKALLYLNDYDNPNLPGWGFNIAGNIEEGFYMGHSNDSSEYININSYYGVFRIGMGSASDYNEFEFSMSGLGGNYKAPLS